jgi:hypothetical protein
MSDTLPLARRREVFIALVAAQDGGLSARASRIKVSTDEEISEKDLLGIENEGLQKQWPPLG